MSRSRLILVAHGSRGAAWRRSVEKLWDELNLELDKGSVSLAFMELISPTLSEAVEVAVREGIEHVRVLPFFMAAGKHVERDIPKQVQDASVKYPTVNIELLPAIVNYPPVYEAMKKVVREAALG